MAEAKPTQPRKKMTLRSWVLIGCMVVCVILFFLPYAYDAQQTHERNLIAQKYVKRAYPADERRDQLIRQYNENAVATQRRLPKPYPDVTFKQIQADQTQSVGYVSIPSIKLESMPVFYGDDATVLSQGVGILPFTSLPAGGDNVTASLTAHTGMSNQVFFDNIRYLKKGDVIKVNAFAHRYAYRVDSHKVIDPLKRRSAAEAFYVKDPKNKIILMTCTPIGINDHRYLVYAHRVPWAEAKQVKTRARATFSWLNLWAYAFLLLLLVLALLFWYYARKARRLEQEETDA